MAQFEVHNVSVDVGAITGAGPFPAIFLPQHGGAYKILTAKLIGSAAGTSVGANLITLTNVGTPAASGTVGSAAGTVVYAAKVPAGITISSADVDPGSSGIWLGLEQTSGTAPANTILSVSYVMGK